MANSFVFIDSRVADYQSIVAGLGANYNYAILALDKNGILQMQETLAGYSNLDSIHVISHGSEGALYLGSEILNQDSFFHYEKELKSIGASLSDSGDLLLYGCNVGQGEVGENFVNYLASIPGADVSASENLTSSPSLIADLVLEVSSGFIENDTVFTVNNNIPLPLSVITGDAQSNILSGTSESDIFDGGDGDDVFFGGGGLDSYYGGQGFDVGKFDFSILTVDSDFFGGGLATFSSVEKLVFTDGQIRLNSDDDPVFLADSPASNITDNPSLSSIYGDSILAGKNYTGERYFTYKFVHSPSLGSWSAYEKLAFENAFRSFESVLGIKFIESNASDVDLTLNKVNSFFVTEQFGSANILGAFPRPSDQMGGTGFFNVQHTAWTQDSLKEGGQAYLTIIHELGHALGLSHPHDVGGGSTLMPGVIEISDSNYTFGDHGLNQGIWTVMSYNDGWASKYPDWSGNKSYGFEASLMAFDIAALQQKDGSRLQSDNTSNVYVLPSADGAGSSFKCIYDVSGQADTITAQGAVHSAIIDLRSAPLVGPNAGGYVSYITGIHGGFTISNSSKIENAIGSILGDKIIGNTGSNLLNGMAGADTLIGGLGNDTYVVDSLSDVVTEFSGHGTDLIQTSLAYSLMDTDGGGTNVGNVENLQLTGSGNVNATGNTLNNTLYANSGNNTLNGVSGSDTASYQYASAAVVVSLALSGAEATGGSGSDTLKNIVNLTGSAYGDSLAGDGNANVLNGMAGADTLAGGLVNDTYVVDSLSDVVTEFSGHGTDLVQTSLAYSLMDTDGGGTNGGNVENLQLTGSGNVNATGNTLNNTLYANSGNNTLNGVSGSDTASYQYASAAVVVSLALSGAQATGGSGSDTLKNIDNLTGSAYGDRLAGDGNANVLNGMAGADTLAGGLGNDAYVVDSLSDVVTEFSGHGTDLVQTRLAYSLMDTDGGGTNGGNVENLQLTGSGNVNATGNTLNNTLYANSGNNTLNGVS